ncbi:MAG TPA: beta-galactosidase domain 4-containing protein, partial [Candidatus Didemnitutus sp.]|nr:beta-galactosidase domain 4-containing protein [Candidatus Didemnitutus sp.]
ASPHIAGGAIWMFQDQGILRAAKSGETPASSHNLGLNVWPDAQHYYDSHGNQGMDGIVYSDRTPQVDYWQVSKVYSPVQIAETGLPLKAGANQFSVSVENRFDFRSLDGLTLEWTLMPKSATAQHGSQALHTAAHAIESIAIEMPVNEGTSPNDLNWLQLRVVDAKGTSIYERNLRLRAAGTVDLAAQLAAELSPGKLSLRETVDTFVAGHRNFSAALDRATGVLTVYDGTGRALATGFQPHIGRRFTEGEFMRAKKELTWTNAPLKPDAKLETSAAESPDGILLRVRGRYLRSDAPEQSLEGETTLLLRATGMIDVSYDWVPANGKGLLLEAGLEMRLPPEASQFEWVGAGPFPGYPGKDALNEFGRYQLHRDDLNFSGNRRDVELASLTDTRDVGVLLLPGKPADIAVERIESGTILSHNALVSGRGTKFVGPDTFIKAEAAPHLIGKFALLPMTSAMSNDSAAKAEIKPFKPYLHSYDQ